MLGHCQASIHSNNRPEKERADWSAWEECWHVEEVYHCRLEPCVWGSLSEAQEWASQLCWLILIFQGPSSLLWPSASHSRDILPIISSSWLWSGASQSSPVTGWKDTTSQCGQTMICLPIYWQAQARCLWTEMDGQAIVLQLSAGSRRCRNWQSAGYFQTWYPTSSGGPWHNRFLQLI